MFCFKIRQLEMGSWMGASHQKDHTMVRSLEFSASPQSPHPPERGEGLEMTFVTDYVHMRKSP